MLSSIFTAAVLSLAGIASAVNVDKASCLSDTGLWVEPVKAGLEWGNVDEKHYFCEAGHVDGNVLTGVRVWRGDWAVWGLQFKWGDGDFGKIYGTDTDSNDVYRDPDQELVWQATDEVEIKLWNNAGKSGLDGVGWIKVLVNKKEQLSQGSDHTGDEVVSQDGSKRIIALSGKAPSLVGTKGLIEILQFHYMESTIVRAVMTKIDYTKPMDQFNKNIEKAKVIVQQSYFNNNTEGGLNQTFTATLSAQYTASKEISSTMTHTIGAGFSYKTSFEVGVPEIASTKVEIGTEISYSFAKMDSESNTVTQQHTISLATSTTPQGVPPQYLTTCTGTVDQGEFESDYVAEITATLSNGKTYIFKEYGHAKSISQANQFASCSSKHLTPEEARKYMEKDSQNSKKRAVKYLA